MSFPQPEKHEGFTLVVTTTVQPGKLDEFLDHFWKVVKLVSSEPECLSFEVFRYSDEPDKLKWIENWGKSKEWFFEVSFLTSSSHVAPDSTLDMPRGYLVIYIWDLGEMRPY
jgi:hypothetical protein